MAKTRDVAEVVRSLDADKLQGERQRVRDSIEMLGRAEIAASKVPMPREGTPCRKSRPTIEIPAPARTCTGASLESSSDGTPVVVRTATPDSNALKWFVMVLAVVVFLYAGFLVWQLLRSPGTEGPKEPAERSPATEVEPSPVVAPIEAEPVDAGRDHHPTGEGAKEGTGTQEQHRSAAASPTTGSPKESAHGAEALLREPVKPVKKAASPPPAPSPNADPVDIDIQNPYRN